MYIEKIKKYLFKASSMSFFVLVLLALCNNMTINMGHIIGAFVGAFVSQLVIPDN